VQGAFLALLRESRMNIAIAQNILASALGGQIAEEVV
jgi:hypothetical protein